MPALVLVPFKVQSGDKKSHLNDDAMDDQQRGMKQKLLSVGQILVLFLLHHLLLSSAVVVRVVCEKMSV